MKNGNIQGNAHESDSEGEESTETPPLSKPRIQPAKKYAITERTRLNYLVVVKNLFKFSEKNGPMMGLNQNGLQSHISRLSKTSWRDINTPRTMMRYAYEGKWWEKSSCKGIGQELAGVHQVARNSIQILVCQRAWVE